MTQEPSSPAAHTIIEDGYSDDVVHADDSHTNSSQLQLHTPRRETNKAPDQQTGEQQDDEEDDDFEEGDEEGEEQLAAETDDDDTIDEHHPTAVGRQASSDYLVPSLPLIKQPPSKQQPLQQQQQQQQHPHSSPIAGARATLPLSHSFLQSLSEAPPLSASASSSSLSSASNQGSNISATNPTAAHDDAEEGIVPCPCQAEIDVMNNSTVTPRKLARVSSSMNTSPITSTPTSPTLSNMSNPALQQPPSPFAVTSPVHHLSPPAIPNSIATILASIATAADSPASPLELSTQLFSAQSLQQIIDYLESLCHHLSIIKSQIYRTIQHATQAQHILLPNDTWVQLLESKTVELIDALKAMNQQEQELRVRIDRTSHLINKAKKQQQAREQHRGVTASFPSFLPHSSRSYDELLYKQRLDRETCMKQLEAIVVQRSTLQQQLLCCSSVLKEMKENDTTKRSYDNMLEAVTSTLFILCFGIEEQMELKEKIEIWAKWQKQAEHCAAQLYKIGMTQQEMRNRLDELIIMHWK